ncbi:LysR family transcriptional regulator [Ferviditalea candida]|uniref:LysR family transcriptional regulator n=1 Tax=Ferviditalea candida TaxID=3108399 RepID=A0ABU5ZDZ1_9BACL|nr:LysR family transcriptional regulator [Paenibacillaceae bacterium T2]
MFESLEIFAVVVEHNSLNRASKTLNLSQPALSRKIKMLEDELDIELFRRIGKKLELTEAGETAYEYAKELRDLQKRFLHEMTRYKSIEKCSITIGASLTTLQSTLPDLISLFTNVDPHIDIKLVTGRTHEMVTVVKEKKADIGLVASKIDDDPTLQCVPLFEDHLSLILPKQHALAGKSSVSIHQLNGLPMIVFSKGTWYRILMDDLFHRFKVVPEIKMDIDSFEAIIRLVSTCQIATLLPQSYLRPNLLENLVQVEIPELKQTIRTTSLIYNKHSMSKDCVQPLIKQAQQHFLNR